MLIVAICVGLALAIPLSDSLIGKLIWRSPTDIRLDYYESDVDEYFSVVFPGFSNPLKPFGEGMHSLLKAYGPMLVVGYDRAVTVEQIVQAIMCRLRSVRSGYKLIIYGHSMGGLIGEFFRIAYEEAGSPNGPVAVMFLDCTPDGRRSSKFPGGAWLARLTLTLWRGGPLLSLLVALGNWYSRQRMPVRVDGTHSADLYRRYAKGIKWFPSRDWTAQLRFLLQVKLPEGPAKTKARIVYLGAAEPKRDMLVDQVKARCGLLRRFPNMYEKLIYAIGHAWPIERRWDYAELIEEQIKAS